MLIVFRKLEHWLSQQQTGRLTIPSWAVFILNCPNLTQLQYFEQSHPRVGGEWRQQPWCIMLRLS